MIASASAVLRELPGTSRRKLGKKPCCLQRGFLFLLACPFPMNYLPVFRRPPFRGRLPGVDAG